MVSTEELRKKAESGERMQLSDVPEEFIGTLMKEEMRVDTQGRDCIYLNIDVDGKLVTQKMTSMHITELIKALEKLGVKDTSELSGKKVQWKAKTFRIGFPRHLPVKIVGG